MGQIIKKQNNEVKKHIATIHCANTLTLLQRKLSNALLYHAYPELAQKEEHEITIKQLCNIIGYSGNNHAVIKAALKGLISCVIEWNVIDEKTGEEEEDWTASAIIASANIKGPRCIYAYSPRMKKLLHSPSIYGKINLIVQSKFRSSYGLALYENCVRYKGLPYTKWFELDLFRKIMGIVDNKYELFRDFKKRVLDKSVEEINAYSDIIVEPEINRQGHKVIAIRFKLKEREKKKWLGSKLEEGNRAELLPPKTPLVEKLIEGYGFTHNKIFALLKEYTEEFIWGKIKLIEASSSYQAGKIDKLAAYLTKAIKENYQPSKSSNEVQTITNKKKEAEHRRKIERAKQEEAQKHQYAKYIAEHIDQTIMKLSPKQLNQLKNNFEKEIAHSKNIFILTKIKKSGLGDKTVHVHFREFIKNKYTILLPDLMNFEEYKEGIIESTE